jgi:large subunit ribosomal protein L31e
MAKKKDQPKTVLERSYNVPLRKEYMKAPNWKRTPKAVKALKQFIQRHMKSDDVLIGKYANLLLWKNGIKKPPHHIKVNAVKDDKGTVKVELVDLPPKATREDKKQKDLKKKKEDRESKKAEETKPKPGAKEEIKGPPEEEKATEGEEIKELKKEKEEKAKEIQKEEIKEMKEEQQKHHRAPKLPPQPRQVEQHPTAPKQK